MTIARTRHVAAVSVLALVGVCAAAGCRTGGSDSATRASGYVEATEVRVAPEVGGRILEIAVREGDRVNAGATIARLDDTDTAIALQRAQAERDQAAAQLRLLQAGARAEDVRQAKAQLESAQAEAKAAEAELASARQDLSRFEALLASNAGSRKQRDDAATRVAVSEARVNAARERARAASEALARLQAGARAEEVAAARARVAAAEAQIASLLKSQKDATLTSPVSGFVTAKLADAGEVIARGTPIVTISDLDHAWANVYVDEPLVPQLKLGQPVALFTDAGQRVQGNITFISPKAEFTPRNVQTAEERTKLVYRIKVTTDNREGILKPGMPVEAEIPRTGESEKTG
jgi:HlyD family secretion protein